MKMILIVCMLVLFGCAGIGARPAADIVAHPSAVGFNCFSPEFFKEVMSEFEDSLGGRVSFVGNRVLLEHPVFEGYKCISLDFYNEIMTELENDINRKQEDSWK